jgi:peptide/nickel transport system permease protein
MWKRRLWLIRKSPLTLIGGAIMLIMLFLMIFSPWLVPHDPNAIDLTARLQRRRCPTGSVPTRSVAICSVGC